MKNPAVVGLVAVLTAGVLVGGYYLYQASHVRTLDSRLRAALEDVQNPRTYEVEVTTATALSDRSIEVLGLYKLDFDADRFGAYATTTLTIPKAKPSERTHTFTFLNLSIENDVYVHIDTDSELLRETIPRSTDWRHFKADAIPAQFKDIAVSGPVLDNVALLGKRGAYLTLSEEPTERQFRGEQFRVYEFTLSEKARAVVGGTLEQLVRRIGSGHVFVWVDETPAVRMLTFAGENYSSTTTVQSVNRPVTITPPALSK